MYTVYHSNFYSLQIFQLDIISLLYSAASISTKDSRRGNVENVLEMDLTSEVADIRMSTKLENKNMKTVAMNMDLTYVIPKIARDKIKLVSKFNNLGTKSLTKWKASM